MNHTPIKIAVTCAVAALFMTHPAWALNNRSWVVSFGSDANNCTSFFPCKTFQHAHDVTVDGGEVDALDAGDYGTLTISKSITIDGGNMGYIQVTTPGSDAIQVNAPPTGRVILRNLSIAGLPAVASTAIGIGWNTGQSLAIEGVSINGVYYGIWAAVATSTDFPAPRLLITDVAIRNCGGTGILVSGFESGGVDHATRTEATVDHAIIDNTPTGVFVQGGKAIITRSVIAHATVGGVEAGAEINLEDSSVVYSAVGLSAAGTGALIRMAGDNIHDNTVGLQYSLGGQIISFGTNRILGNGSGETPGGTAALK